MSQFDGEVTQHINRYMEVCIWSCDNWLYDLKLYFWPDTNGRTLRTLDFSLSHTQLSRFYCLPTGYITHTSLYQVLSLSVFKHPTSKSWEWTWRRGLASKNHNHFDEVKTCTRFPHLGLFRLFLKLHISRESQQITPSIYIPCSVPSVYSFKKASQAYGHMCMRLAFYPHLTTFHHCMPKNWTAWSILWCNHYIPATSSAAPCDKPQV